MNSRSLSILSMGLTGILLVTAGCFRVGGDVNAATELTANVKTDNADPTITGLVPTAGALAGGTLLTINGTGFIDGATVTVGGVDCQPVTVVSETQMTCTTGAHDAGAVDVVVTNSDSKTVTLSASYTYQLGPTATSIFPSFGPMAVGTSVTVFGSNFLTGATVKIGGVDCSNPTVQSNQITCTTGKHTTGGKVDVVVSNSDNQSSTLASGYAYDPFPYLKVSNGGLVGDVTNQFAGAEKRIKLMGATISNQVNGPSTASPYTDLFWTSAAGKSDPNGFLDLVLDDIEGAGLNSVRLGLNYCEWGGAGTANVPAGCATTYSGLNSSLHPLLNYFVKEASLRGIMVELTLFDQFRNYGSDNTLNQQWLDDLISAMSPYRNVVWVVQNEPLAWVWREKKPADVSTSLSNVVGWYDTMALYLKNNDKDTFGNQRHLVGMSFIHAGTLDALNLNRYDIIFMHTANRRVSPGGYLDAAIYKLLEKGVSKPVVIDEMACSEFWNACKGTAGNESDPIGEYFKVAVRSINNRLLKVHRSPANSGAVHVDGGMVWTLYDSCEEKSGCDITDTNYDLNKENFWGIYECLPDQACGANRKKTYITNELDNLAFKTNFKALTAPTYEGTMSRTETSSIYVWDTNMLHPEPGAGTEIHDDGSGAASVWDWWNAAVSTDTTITNPENSPSGAINLAMLFSLQDFDANGATGPTNTVAYSSGKEALRAIFTRNYCWGSRQTGPLDVAGGNYTDSDLSDNTDVYLTFKLRDVNGAENPIPDGTFSFSLNLGNAGAGGIGGDLWGNDTAGGTIPDVDVKRVAMDEYHHGYFEFNISQILRDEGMSGGQLVALNIEFAEKIDSSVWRDNNPTNGSVDAGETIDGTPLTNDGCHSIVSGPGAFAGTKVYGVSGNNHGFSLSEMQLKEYTMSFTP